MGDYSKAVLSRHNRETAHINSQLLGCLAQEKARQNRSMERVAIRKLLEVMLAGKGRSSFLQECRPREASHIPGDGPTSVHIEAALCRLRKFRKRAHKIEREE